MQKTAGTSVPDAGGPVLARRRDDRPLRREGGCGDRTPVAQSVHLADVCGPPDASEPIVAGSHDTVSAGAERRSRDGGPMAERPQELPAVLRIDSCLGARCRDERLAVGAERDVFAGVASGARRRAETARALRNRSSTAATGRACSLQLQAPGCGPGRWRVRLPPEQRGRRPAPAARCLGRSCVG